MRKIYLTILLILIASFAYADTIKLKSGKIIEGKITQEALNFLRIDIGAGVDLRYYLDEITAIKRDPDLGQGVFELKETPLIPLESKKEPSPAKSPQQSAGQAPDLTLDVVKEEAPLLETKENLALGATLATPQDRENIGKIINNYFDLVVKPLPLDENERKQSFSQLEEILDLKNMRSYLFFRQMAISARRESKNPLDENFNASLKEKFLEAVISGFQGQYDTSQDNTLLTTFKIKEVNFINSQQAKVLIEYQGRIISLKLHNINSRWLIYSLN